MGRKYFTALVIVCVFQITGVIAAELVANYKFWESASNQIIYDYSGNSRHGQFKINDPLYTDRGIVSSSYLTEIIFMSFISTLVPGYSDFALSFWAFRISGDTQIFTKLFGSSGGDEFIYFLSASSTTILYKGTLYSGYSAISGWNLYTVRIYSNPTNSAQWYLHLYNNLADF